LTAGLEPLTEIKCKVAPVMVAFVGMLAKEN
jgi:hypothetical protein